MKIFMSPEVADRIRFLVEECDKEVAWQGLAHPVRGDKKKTLVGMRIEEIFVPKQHVTAASVDHKDEDQFGFMDLLTEQGREQDIARISYHGHSHVNMGVSPSGTDTGFYEEAVQGGDESLKLFCCTIHNKKGEASGRVYLWIPTVGLIWYQADVVVDSVEEVNPLRAWAKEEIAAKVSTFRPLVTYGAQRWDGKDWVSIYGGYGDDEGWEGMADAALARSLRESESERKGKTIRAMTEMEIAALSAFQAVEIINEMNESIKVFSTEQWEQYQALMDHLDNFPDDIQAEAYKALR